MKKIMIDAAVISAVIGLLYTRYIDISIYNAKPDILFIFIIIIGLFENGYHPIFLGFSGGLVIDFISGSTLPGFNALVYTLIGYLTVLPHKFLHIESPFVASGIIVFFFLFKAFFIMTAGYIFLSTDFILGYIHSVLPGEVIYTAILTIPLFAIIKKIYKFTDDLKKYV